jgi:integrase
MRNANGFGSVYKLSGKRRKPWVVSITTGWEIRNNKEVQVRKIIGYYSTKIEGQKVLFEYNDNKYNINYLNYTFEDIYNKMLESKKEISRTTLNSYKMSYNILEDIHLRKFNELRLNDYQKIINNSDKEYHTLRKVKSLISIIYDFSLKNEMYNGNNFSEYIDIGKSTTEEKVIFSDDEINILWKNKDKDIIKIILILIYSGLRIGELLDLKKENVYIDERYLDIKDSKTNAGIRKVPINHKILDFIKEFYNKNEEYLLLNRLGKQFKYSNFKREYFDRTINNLGFNSKISIHSTRHTTISLLVRNNANSTHIKKIVGHSSFEELYERVYNHSNLKELIETIDLI